MGTNGLLGVAHVPLWGACAWGWPCDYRWDAVWPRGSACIPYVTLIHLFVLVQVAVMISDD
jgi:hypothetical protein